MKPPVILRIFKGTQLLEVKQFDSEQIILGNSSDAQVKLDDESVSAIHCLIELRDNGYYLADLGSSKGTFKNDQPILDEPISSGDQIKVGPFVVHFFVGVPKPKAPPQGVTAPPPAASAKAQVTAAPAPPPMPPPAQAAKPSAPPAPEVASKPAAATPPPVPRATPQNAAPVAKAPPKLPEASASLLSKNRESSAARAKKSRRSWGTFAPPSAIQDLREYLRPTKGPILEVLLTWQERILSSSHFSSLKNISIGSDEACDIVIPVGFGAVKAPFIEVAGGTRIALQSSWEVDLIREKDRLNNQALLAVGKISGQTLRVEQGEVACITVGNGSLQVFVRHIPAAPAVAMSGLDLTGGELTGLFVSLIVVAFFALYMSVYTPPPAAEDKADDQLRLASFVYNKKQEPKKVEVVKVEDKKEEKPPTPPPKPVKVKVTDKPSEAKAAPAKPADSKAARASDVRAMPKNNKPKKFTSIKQGGSVKIGETAGANAQSAKDVNKTGLLAAFGNTGNRTQLDKAYSGSGELLGMADKATGTSGQNADRAGDDLGSKFKDSGAGGKGTATQGIANIGTKGRSSGQASYGDVGVGGKGHVNIEAGGAGAEFVGSVDREAVRRVVKSIYGQIKDCYDRALRGNSELEGKVVIHWEVTDQGHVQISRVKEAPSELQGVGNCIAMRIKEQRFPDPPGGSVYDVDYPFVMGK